MKKNLLWIYVMLFTFVFGYSQDIQKTLIKAYTSQDSSDYFFKKAKKAIKTKSALAEYYFCKNARCTDYNIQDSSLYYGRIAAKMFLDIKDYNKYMYVLGNMGKTYVKQGRYDKAIEGYFTGLKVAEREKNNYWIQTYPQCISIAYHDFEEYKKGVEYGKKALHIALHSKEIKPLDVSSALNAIAINFDDWKKPDSALAYHFKVFNYVKGADTLKIGNTYNNIGNTLLKLKKFKQAQKWINRAVAIAKANNNGPKNSFYYYENATNYNNLATIAYETNEFDKAEILFDTSYYYASRSESIEKLRDYYYCRYLFNKKRKNNEKALGFQEEYLKLRDSIFKKDREATFAELETKYQTEKKEHELLLSKTKILQKENEIKRKNIQSIVLWIVLFGILIVGYLLYHQQKIKNKQQKQEFELKAAISKIETQNKLQEQRLQISRDLHDNIGSQLTFIISSVDNIKYAFDIKNLKLDEKLSTISAFTKSTIIELRDTIWAMNHDEISFEDLRVRIHNFMEKAKEVKENISFAFDIDASLKGITCTSVQGMNIYRTVQEAVNNSIKYADASQIRVIIQMIEEKVSIQISDNGKGFNLEEYELGNGIVNMKKRITDINGTLTIYSKIGQGTTITILLEDIKA
jgi:signal transduction histidine kinase